MINQKCEFILCEHYKNCTIENCTTYKYYLKNKAESNNQKHTIGLQKELIEQLKEKLRRCETQLVQSFRTQKTLTGGWYGEK